jgi:hypothetical protein
VALGVVLVAVCALGGLALYRSGRARQAVLVVTRRVGPGQVITGADVGVAHLGGDGWVRALGAGSRSAVIGQRAAVALWPGELVLPDQVSSGPSVPAGEVAMGVALKPGRFPSDLAAGDRVLLIPTEQAATASSLADSSAPVSGRVTRVIAPSLTSTGNDVTGVDLDVPADAAAQLATAAAADRLAVVVAP